MLGKVVALVIGGCLSVIVLDAAPPFTGPYPLQNHDHAAPMRSWRALAKRPVVSVLFIGNSFTFTHDIPAQLVNLASSDARSPVDLEVSASTIPGGTLKQAWSDGKALKMLQSRHVDYVVLQDWSIWPFRDDVRSGAYEAFGKWAAAARQAGAQPVLYQTWADKADSDSYKPDWPYAGLTPASAQATIESASRELASMYQLPIVDVGGPFIRLAGEPATPDLYGGDSHHPSQAGAYLAAAIMFKALTAEEPMRSSYRPNGLSEADRQAILSALAAG